MPDSPPPKRRRRLLRLWHLMALMPVAAAATVWFVLPPRGPTAPLRLDRAEDGHLELLFGDLNRDGPLDVDAATITGDTVQLQSRAGSGSRGSWEPRLADRSLLILNLSDHPLLRQLGGALLEELDDYEPFERVDFLPPGFAADPDRHAPDLILTLDLVEIDEDRAPLRHEIDAAIAVRLFTPQGQTSQGVGTFPRLPGHDRNHERKAASAPLVTLDEETLYRHESTTTGPVPSPQRYELAGESIAATIAPELTEQLREIAEGRGRMPPLPDAFRPAYREPPDSPPLDALGAERIYSVPGLLHSNTTLWRFRDERLITQVLGDLRARFEALGWTGEVRRLGDGDHLLLRRPDSLATLEIAPVPPWTAPGAATAPEEPTKFEAVYVDPMTMAEVDAAVDLLLDDPDPPLSALLAFQQYLDDDGRGRVVALFDDETPVETILAFQGVRDAGQCRRILELLERRTLEDAEHWLALGRFRQQVGRSGAAGGIPRGARPDGRAARRPRPALEGRCAGRGGPPRRGDRGDPRGGPAANRHVRALYRRGPGLGPAGGARGRGARSPVTRRVAAGRGR